MCELHEPVTEAMILIWKSHTSSSSASQWSKQTHRFGNNMLGQTSELTVSKSALAKVEGVELEFSEALKETSFCQENCRLGKQGLCAHGRNQPNPQSPGLWEEAGIYSDGLQRVEPGPRKKRDQKNRVGEQNARSSSCLSNLQVECALFCESEFPLGEDLQTYIK